MTTLIDTDNLQNGSGTKTGNGYAVELVTLSNGTLVMITSERAGPTDGISSYLIDNDPDSPTYGQMIGTTPTSGGTGDQSAKVDSVTAADGPGHDTVAVLAALTLSNGLTFVYTADYSTAAIGIDLPLNFHPAATGAHLVFTLIGAG